MARVGQNRRNALLILLLSFGLSARWALAAGEELSWGIEPFLHPRTLATTFKSARDFLGERTGQRIVTATAPNYDLFVSGVLRSEYDLALVGPHTALLAMQKAGYQSLIQCDGALRAILVVDKNSAYKKPQDLKGQVIALPDHLTITSMLGAEFFRPPLSPQAVEVQYKFNDFQNSGPLLTLRGEAAAAVMADEVYDLISPQIRNDLRVIGESRSMPRLTVLVHTRIAADKRARLREASLAFLRTADPRVNLFVRGCGATEKVLTEDNLRQLQPYVEELKRRLPQ